MGRSRGGLTTKIHALVDANGLPVMLKLTEGQAHVADRAYDSDALRQTMTAQGAWANIQPLPVPIQEPRRALLQQGSSTSEPLRPATRSTP